MEQGWSGSILDGPKTNGWLEGEARCILPNGVVYEGQFKGGNFHGKGILIYPDRGRYTAEWEEGRAVRGNFSFIDGLPYQAKEWSYLASNDRRLVNEVCDGFDAQKAVQCPRAKVPSGTYDTGDGYFNRETGEIRSYDGNSVVAVPNAFLADWIVRQCRRNATEHSKSTD